MDSELPLTTDHCVSSTARLAGDLGFETYVVAAATAAFEMESHDRRRFSAKEIHTVALVNPQGELATIVSTEDVLSALRDHEAVIGKRCRARDGDGPQPG